MQVPQAMLLPAVREAMEVWVVTASQETAVVAVAPGAEMAETEETEELAAGSWDTPSIPALRRSIHIIRVREAKAEILVCSESVVLRASMLPGLQAAAVAAARWAPMIVVVCLQ